MLEFLDTSLIRNTALPRYDSTASLHPVRLAPGPGTPFGLLDRRRMFERVERSRARHGPFEARGAVPRLVAGLLEFATAAVSRQRDSKEEVHLGQAEAERTDRDDLVPVGELRGVVGVTTRHACETHEVHRQEREVEEDHRAPKMDLAGRL